MNETKGTVAAERFAEAVGIMARLRAPGGCPWDREQDFDSIKRHTLEETYEVFDAIERRAWPDLKDELGDLLLQVLFYAQMAEEAGHFSIADVVRNLNEKLVRRHPHIFGDVSAEDSDTVLRNWEAIKASEKRSVEGKNGMLDAVPRTMPAMMEAGKLGNKAAKVGFNWPEVEGLFEKMEEEIAELKAEVASGDSAALEREFGDVMFTFANLGRHLKVDTETALRGTNARFRARFGRMEVEAGGVEGLKAASLDELERMWGAAKVAERAIEGAKG